MASMFNKKYLLIAFSAFSANVCLAQSIGADLQREIARQESEQLESDADWRSLLQFTSSINSFENGFIKEDIYAKVTDLPDKQKILTNLDSTLSPERLNCVELRRDYCSIRSEIIESYRIDPNLTIDDSNYVVIGLGYHFSPDPDKMQSFFQSFKMGISSEEVIWSDNESPYLRKKAEGDALFSVAYRSVAKDKSPKPGMPKSSDGNFNKRANSMMGLMGAFYNRAFVRRTLSPPTRAMRADPAFGDLLARNTQDLCSSDCFEAVPPPVTIAAFNSKGDRIPSVSQIRKFEGLASIVSGGLTTESMVYIKERFTTAFVTIIPKNRLAEIASFKVIKVSE